MCAGPSFTQTLSILHSHTHMQARRLLRRGEIEVIRKHFDLIKIKISFELIEKKKRVNFLCMTYVEVTVASHHFRLIF